MEYCNHGELFDSITNQSRVSFMKPLRDEIVTWNRGTEILPLTCSSNRTHAYVRDCSSRSKTGKHSPFERWRAVEGGRFWFIEQNDWWEEPDDIMRIS